MSNPFRLVRLGQAAALIVPAVIVTACSGTDQASIEPTSSIRAALTGDAGSDGATSDAGLITISGTVADSQSPQAGITITLSGSADAQVVTNVSGTYSFSVKPGGSYSLTAAGSNNYFAPPFHSCLTVTPSIVNLNNLTASTTVNFVGSGTDPILNCAPAASTGATSGSLTLSGQVTSGGQPVAGVRVSLNGNAQGYRTTDETGSYSFAVNPGSYSVNPSGVCGSLSPSVVNLNNLRANTTQNFTGTSCPPAPLTLCPTFDALFSAPEPASCNTVSTTSCAFGREFSWEGAIVGDYIFVENSGDCRFGLWNLPPIVNDFTSYGFSQWNESLNLFALQLFGCSLYGNLTGPLEISSLIPPDLLRAGLTFTTADVSALEDEYVAAINQGLADFGLAPITAAQTTAIRAQLDYAASRLPGLISSSKLSYSNCP